MAKMEKPFEERKFYLGDSVYVEFDGVGVVLTTENGLPDDPSNKIYLDPNVMESFAGWLVKIKGILNG